jgi:hypothetical protein
MAYTFEQLSAMTVTQLRDIAKDVQHDAVHGFSTMHKEKLVPALCHALGIEDHAHHHVVGIDKGSIKAQIRALKQKRDTAIQSKNAAELKDARRHIKTLKKALRKAMV